MPVDYLFPICNNDSIVSVNVATRLSESLTVSGVGSTSRILPVMGLGSADGSTLRLHTRLVRGSMPYQWWCDAVQ